MADIFREVDEEVRKDRVKALWQRYGMYVYIVIAALILGTAGRQYWQHYQEQRRQQEATSLQSALSALQRQQTSQAINDLDTLARDADTGYAILARLHEAAARAESGDLKGAVRAYDALAADDAVQPVYRDLARLLAAMHMVDSGDPAEVRRRIAPLAADGQPWRFSAREVEAALALRENQREEARKTLQGLADDAETPAGVRARANELLAAMAGEE